MVCTAWCLLSGLGVPYCFSQQCRSLIGILIDVPTMIQRNRKSHEYFSQHEETPQVDSESTSTMSPSLLPIDAFRRVSFEQCRAGGGLGKTLSGEYLFADRFPTSVIDDFLPEDVVRLALDNFPTNPIASDTIFEDGSCGSSTNDKCFPEDCDAPQKVVHFFNSAPFVEFLEGSVMPFRD